MHNIERRPSGFLLTFGGNIDAAEMETWCRESERALASVADPFGVVVDMRTLAPLGTEVQQIMVKGQSLYKAKFQDALRMLIQLANELILFHVPQLDGLDGITAREIRDVGGVC